MIRIIVAAAMIVMAFAIFSCGTEQDPLEDENLLAPGNRNNGTLPHDGRCVSYCARAVVHALKPGVTELPMEHPDFDVNDWVAIDADGDGKIETCIQEEPKCIKDPGCPESPIDPTRCVLPGDGIRLWCRLMHGKDMHGKGHKGMAPTPNVGNKSAFGRCVAYCNRAIVYMYVDDGDGKGGMTVPEGDPNFDEDDWVAIDMDGDGKIERCTKEEINGETCFKVFGGCPEPDGTCGARPQDGIGFWCRLMKGNDPHIYPN